MLSADGKAVYIKLAGESNKNITKIKFVFVDAEGKEHNYETSEGTSEINVPFKRSFWDWLFGKPKFEGKYDYEINASDLELENFNNINEVSVAFEYKTETNQTIITPKLDTTKPTPSQNKTTTPSSSGGPSGGPSTEPTPTCIDSDTGINYYEKGTASYSSTTKEDYCNDSILFEYYCNETNIEQINYNCSVEGKICLDGKCVNVSCTNDSQCEEVFGGGYSCDIKGKCVNKTTIKKTSQISQFGITWYFDKEYEYGTFANGDYWVVTSSSIGIIRIDPSSYIGGDGYTRNGSMINPSREFPNSL